MTSQMEELLEQSGKCAAIADLYNWSLNYQGGVTPFGLFLDLIGYSKEFYGEYLVPQDEVSKITGFIELDLIGNALVVYSNLPRDVEEFIDKVVQAEQEE